MEVLITRRGNAAMQKKAIFPVGTEFNSFIKSKATASTYKSFSRSSSAPQTSVNVWDVSVGGIPIYVWMNSVTGGYALYWYSEADKVYFNDDCAFMFADLTGCTSFDLTGISLQYIRSCMYMFQSCSSWALDGYVFGTDSDLQYVENITNLDGMFARCTSLAKADLTNLLIRKRKVTTGFMFDGCTSLRTFSYVPGGMFGLDLVYAPAMFYNCTAMTSFNMRRMILKNATNTNGMFSGCSNLATITVRFDYEQPTPSDSTGMFTGCTKLVGGNGTTYSSSHVDATYARIDGAGTPGYMTMSALA